MSTDAELLRRYVAEKSEAAFAELVQRHLPLVYSAAVRQVGGDAHLAQDVAQQVFVALARKAATLVDRATLAGWLYLGTHHAAAQAVRSRHRRQVREQEAHVMHELLGSNSAAVDWDRVRPVLDAAMHELSDTDREAVLLRYFEQRPFADVGAALNLSEDAARMRVERALDKLHALLAKRGVTSTTAALALALQGNVIAAVPVGMVTTITSASLASAAGGLVAGSGLIGFMSSIQLGPAAAVAAALVAVGAAVYNVRENRAAETALAVAQQQTAAADTRGRALARRAEAETRATTALEQAIASAQAAAPGRPVAPAEDPDAQALREGAAFLASSPEAQKLVHDMLRGFFDQGYVRAMRQIGLGAQDIERIADEAAARGSMSVHLGTSDLRINIGDPTGKADGVRLRLRELLGDARYQEVEEIRLAAAAKAAVTTVASATFGTDVALTPNQVEALSTLIERNRRVQSRDATTTVFAIDWPAITRGAAGVLSAPQLAVFNAALAKGAPATQTARLPQP